MQGATLTKSDQVIDRDGYRANVAIVMLNDNDHVFWCRRIGQDAWQFPQGGMQPEETPEEAMFRELREETGLLPHHVDIVGRTQNWLRYDLPEHLIRKRSKPLCVGQKQIWYLLRFRGIESDVRLNIAPKPEFDDWCWVDFWQPAQEVIEFKQQVYHSALRELESLIKRG
ncbi:(Di)nucleoside polyphosphate hydrolase [gamma proteobacterium HTCC5015]|nr:(Di)nucleoside polyphosphate hydrolase [gamma proteobacterium HTCC5015]